MTTTPTRPAPPLVSRPPIVDVCRMSAFVMRDAGEEGADGLTLDGYASVFNQWTVIDSWEGRFKERVVPGAMKKSFRENPPRIQFDHGRHVLVGSIPVASNEPGYPREEVDADLAPEGGAHVIARMFDNWLVQPVRDAIAAGAINGMSFRFGVVREAWHDADGKRINDEEKLMEALRRTWFEDVPDDELLQRSLQELRVPELGPVVWPAYEGTSVGMRSVTVDLAAIRNELAQAVTMATRAEESAPEVTDPADDHADDSTDTPDDTAREAAVDHASESHRLERLSFIEHMRANQTNLTRRID